jgi:3-polyprenyl-4-hydroxybenzoate decarboxylase
VLVSLGHDPLLLMVAGTEVPGTISEYAYAGAMVGKLLDVVCGSNASGHSRQAGYIAAQCDAAAYMNRFVIVVDEDIDPMNLEEVVWAVCTRCDPADDIDIMRKSWGSKVDPLVTDPTAPLMSRALIDACRPFARLSSFLRVAEASPRRVRETVAKWRELFSDPRFPLPTTAVPPESVDS